MNRFRWGAVACLAFACALLVPAISSAQTATGNENLVTHIREISFDSNGNTRIIVSVAGKELGTQTLGDGSFTVTEDGKAVDNLTVEPLSKAQAAPTVGVALVMDVSGSTAGAPLNAAKLAAKEFIAGLPSNVRVAILSFGTTVTLVRPFTTDHISLNQGIDSLASDDNTSLYDAVATATNLLVRESGVQRNMVLFTDGHDTTSKTSLNAAINDIRSAAVQTTTVLLGKSTADAGILARLAGAVRGGAALTVGDLNTLHLAFAQAAQAISSQYVLTYKGSDATTKELSLTVAATVGSFQATDSSTVVNQRRQVQASTAPSLVPPPKPLVGAFGGNLGLYVAIAGAFVAAALFIGMLLWAPAGRSEERALQRRLRLYTKSGERKKKKEPAGGSALSGTAVGRGAISLVERLPKPKNFEENLQKELDQAGWPLRSTEFLILQIGGLIAGYLIGGVLLRRVWMGLAFAVLGAIAPRLLLTIQINRRSSAFLEQLPDTLQLLAGSLSAGYGFLQALDTVAKEAVAPTSIEFGRVLSEARLGRPIDEALDDMANRVGGEDFRWVVLAINIQRQVGGNLSALLTTVANTLREREAVRRQIKVLSAEGRLSAYILVALPFVLFGYLSIINPDYVHQLTSATVGKLMMIGGLILIGVGALWMRKVVKIDV